MSFFQREKLIAIVGTLLLKNGKLAEEKIHLNDDTSSPPQQEFEEEALKKHNKAQKEDNIDTDTGIVHVEQET